VPAAAGIPVTERYSSTSFTVVTGHEDATKATNEVDWEAIARVGGTIVILMGVASIRSISRALIEGGLAPSTPVAAVRWGTRPEQSVIRADLATIADQPLRAPSVIVVGDVARAREYAGGHGSLAGARVIVTRAADDPSRLTSMLMGAGAEVIRVPTIDTVGPSDDGVARDRLFAEIDTYEWVILTSPRGARAFLDAVGDLRRLAANRIAVIGPGTAEVLSDNRLIPDLIPHRYVAEGLLEQFPAPVESGRVLIARAEESRGVIEPALEARGWSVDVAPLYRTVPAAVSPERTAEIASADLIVFASSSSVRNFAEAVPRGGWPSTALAIGPVTAATAQELGFDSVVVAEVHTVEGVVRAAETWWAERPR
jgi:uroporphyrinogen III methyltransferase/synthase